MSTHEALQGVAVIGMAGRFPGAANVGQFWRNLRDGVEAISFFSEEELLGEGIDPTLLRDPSYVRAKGVLAGADLFDNKLFGMSAREAESTDPQHRVLLECAWEALENAGHDPDRYEGLIGMFAGCGQSHYWIESLVPNHKLREAVGDFQLYVGNDKDFLATRVAYKLNLRGPSVTIQSACSTSLVAVCIACQSLLTYQCDMALSGGVAVSVPLRAGYRYQQGMVLSPDGHCRAFDAEAQGTVDGNGAGLVVLKRLSDAVADGDHIHAVIRGFGWNNDGSKKIGYSAPSIEGQAQAIGMALAMADVKPESITYIETHGTGTQLGDPIEIAALTRAFGGGAEKGTCAIGSVKTNVGHLDAAAGVAGLIKTVLALEHGLLPPSLHFREANPQLNLESSPFFVNASLRPWDAPAPRRAGVSSFGLGGTNAHVVLEEAPATEASGPSRPAQLLVLSAASTTALDRAQAMLAEQLAQRPDLSLADVAYTLQVGRRELRHRRMVVSCDSGQAVRALAGASAMTSAVAGAAEAPGVAFLFPGGGVQQVDMGLDLYRDEPVFRDTVARCAELLRSHLDFDIRSVLYPREGARDWAAERIRQPDALQPAMFVFEYALATLWMEWGIRPRAMVGHSVGEFAAACLSGVLTLEDALLLVAQRGLLLQSTPTGATVAIPLAAEEVAGLLDGGLSLCAVNSPFSCVVAGTVAEVEALERKLAAREIQGKRLQFDRAAHSSLMDSILDDFERCVRRVALRPPHTPYVSTLLGEWVTGHEVTDPAYWVRHMRQTVRFDSALRKLMADPSTILLEVGPSDILSTLARRHPNKPAQQVVLASIQRRQAVGSEVVSMLQALGQLWLCGVPVSWAGLHRNERRRRVELPTYPFERHRFWVDPPRQARAEEGDAAAGGAQERAALADWFYAPAWKRSSEPLAPRTPAADARWLVFEDAAGIGAELVSRLGERAVSVRPGDRFARLEDRAFSLRPGHRGDHDALLAELAAQRRIPEVIAHLWSIAPDRRDARTKLAGIDQTIDEGFFSLLCLVQALGAADVRHPLRLAVVTRGLQSVSGEPTSNPEQALALGPCRVIPEEYPNIDCIGIDLASATDAPPSNEALEQLFAEIAHGPIGATVALRHGERWLQVLEPRRFEDPGGPPPKLRPRGVYMITGGLGGIGLVLAEYLASAVQARLVLVNRSGFPPREQWSARLASSDAAPQDEETRARLQKLLALEQMGAELLVTPADVGDLEGMQGVVRQTLSRFGALHGVIHAAGVPGGGVIQRKARESAAAVLAPKVRGTMVLEAALEGLSLDFWLLCSSLTAITADFGQVDYCAANCYLDAVARHRATTSGAFTVSVNWDAWKEVGGAVRAAAQRAGMVERPEEQRHPLFDETLLGRRSGAAYRTRLCTSRHWVIAEHRVMGQPTMPGTAYVEMARAAAELRVGAQPLLIRELALLAPLVVPEGVEQDVLTVVEELGDELSIRVMSRPGRAASEVEHMRCRLVPLGGAARKTVDIGEIERGCPEVVPLAGVLDDRIGEFGPRWSCLKSIRRGAGQYIAQLELPAAFVGETSAYKLHPALLDVATGYGLALEKGAYMPFSYHKLVVHAGLPPRLFSHVETATDAAGPDTRKCRVTLYDERGTKLVEIEDYVWRRAREAP